MNKQIRLNLTLSNIVLGTRRSLAFMKLLKMAKAKHPNIKPCGSWDTSLTYVNHRYQLWYNLPNGTTEMVMER